MTKRVGLVVCLCLFFLVFSSCSDEKIDECQPKRTVLIYMAADNNLSGYSNTNINNAIVGAAGDNLNGGNLLVYVDPAGELPQLLQITKNKKGIIEKQIIKTYAEQNSASPEVMKGIIDEVLSNNQYKAESYGLILWSHATAWLPHDYYNYFRSFGEDHGSALTMDDLKSALPDRVFDFIIFDACYMASVEVGYALRNKTSYLLSSPTEVLAQGLPYQFIIKDLFGNEPVSVLLENIGHRFYTYYNEQEEGSTMPKSATISLVKTDAFSQLASVCRDILYGNEPQIANLPIKDIQIMDYLSPTSHALYDFDDYIRRIASEEQYTRFNTVLSELIPYKESTATSYYAYGISLPINHFSGLSVYVPQSTLEKLNDWYQSQDWYKAVYE